MNLMCKFIVMGILVALSVAVVEGASIKVGGLKKPKNLDTSKTWGVTVAAEKIAILTNTTPNPSATVGIAQNIPNEAVTSGALQQSKSNRTPKPSLEKPGQKLSMNPNDSDDKSGSCQNIFGHFYGYFSWMAQFYKWVEKYGKWMAHGVNKMFG